MIAFALAAAAQALAFSCEVEPARNVMVNGANVTSSVIGVPVKPDQWRFDLALSENSDEVSITLNWPGDPITAGKAMAALPEGPHDYAFVSFNGGPCLFTVSACMTMYTLSLQGDGTADILVQPSALGTQGDRSKPFQVFMTGKCRPKAAAQ
jgi:hypothetical protein